MNVEDDESKLTYRSIRAGDRILIQKLHLELFPVHYADSFYDNMIKGIGMYGGSIYSVIIDDGDGNIAGFAIAQMLQYPSQIEDANLFASPAPMYGCYILTLGVASSHRRLGLATKLLNKCKEFARSNSQCGAVSIPVHLPSQRTNPAKLYLFYFSSTCM